MITEVNDLIVKVRAVETAFHAQPKHGSAADAQLISDMSKAADAVDIAIVEPEVEPEVTIEPEDYPGQNDEIRRERLIRQAVEAADRILCDGADGSVEEINYLTAQVALKFAEKVNCAVSSALRSKDLLERKS